MDYRQSKNFRLFQAYKQPILHLTLFYTLLKLSKTQLDHHRGESDAEAPKYVVGLRSMREIKNAYMEKLLELRRKQ